MKSTLGTLALLVLLLCAMISGGYYLAKERQECRARGGAFVRGVVGFECVKGA